MILKNLSTHEVTRFNKLKKLLSGISSTVLADRLLEMEREGLNIEENLYGDSP